MSPDFPSSVSSTPQPTPAQTRTGTSNSQVGPSAASALSPPRQQGLFFPQPPTATASTTTTTAAAAPTSAPASTTPASSVPGPAPGPAPPTGPLHETLPTADQQRHVTEARAAVVASISNLLDSELQSRASLLHANATALDGQERDVARATDGLRRENDRLARWSSDGARHVKELGNVQNWAEVLEREFLVLEETMRLVNEGDGSRSGSGCGSSCDSGSWSGSDVGGDDEDGHGARGGAKLGPCDQGEGKREAKKGSARGGGGGVEDGGDEPGGVKLDDGARLDHDLDAKMDGDDSEPGGAMLGASALGTKGKGRERPGHASVDFDVEAMQTDYSEASQSAVEAESSNDTEGRAKESETTSVSTTV